jgi:hypothetical protein
MGDPDLYAAGNDWVKGGLNGFERPDKTTCGERDGCESSAGFRDDQISRR